ncbi:hypothetical protein MPF19_11275 [Polaribacter sp. Z014]|uniref:LamG domain-containing protein n=1 Tax=Polaribacter sp. Z014 TaxID=2927126 RepID=UPI00201FFE00|nr:LamG-like jellyroll fold domain-containing protein [Polaribacter sp. Z014]MCL7764000.1 hypothetical protein [Polaribacter sp. Z014]
MNERSFAIAEFSDKESITSILQDDLSKGYYGMSIHVIEEPNTADLKLKLDKGSLPLKRFFELLSIQINKTEKKVFPLFIKYSGNDDKLIKLLSATNLLDKSFYNPVGERWPTIEDIIKQKKQLIIFNKDSKSNYINNTSNHITKYALFNNGDKTDLDSVIGNEFLSIKHFTEKKIAKNNIPKQWNSISTNPYSIQYLLRAWKITGKRPNFIFYSSIKHKNTLFYLTNLINETPSIKGTVLSQTNILKGINWQHKIKSYTDGYYNFPYEKGTEFVLKPLKEGYEFTPSSVKISDKIIPNKSFKFEATKLDITKNLTAVYKFENTLDNEIKQEHLAKNTPVFINDKVKGTVLKIENKNYIKLQEVANYKLVNSSFTIAVDFKYITTEDQKTYCILGSDEQGFRKGLHVSILSKKPVFGFYTNDCKPNYSVSPEKWHRLVVKYNLDTQNQSIYIDGAIVGKATNRPSFIGTSNLLLGYGIKNNNNYFNGYIDNLQIWNRALNDDEIKWLAHNTLDLKKKPTTYKTTPLLLIISSCLVIALIFLSIYVRRAKKKKVEPLVSVENIPKKNAIYLFGKFSLINANGVDIAADFSPKLKELFLLVLLRTIKNKKGITTSELTDILWEGFPPAKAANNRGVSFNALKKILQSTEGINVVYQNKFWKVELNENIYLDYNWVLGFINSRLHNYQQFFEVVKRGKFLPEAKKEWLLEERSNLNFDILDPLLCYCKEEYYKENFQTVLQVTTYVKSIDELNIQALYYQLHSLSKEGSKNKIIFIFDNFCQKYEVINAVKFRYKLKEFLQEDLKNIWE